MFSWGDSRGSCKAPTDSDGGGLAVTEVKQPVWEEFGEAMEKYFWSAPRCF